MVFEVGSSVVTAKVLGKKVGTHCDIVTMTPSTYTDGGAYVAAESTSIYFWDVKKLREFITELEIQASRMEEAIGG